MLFVGLIAAVECDFVKHFIGGNCHARVLLGRNVVQKGACFTRCLLSVASLLLSAPEPAAAVGVPTLPSEGVFVPALDRVDMVYDGTRNVLYITNGNSVLRYSMVTGLFFPPYTFGLGKLSGIDLSPDGNTLAIADRTITGIHLVDLMTDTIKPDIPLPQLVDEGEILCRSVRK